MSLPETGADTIVPVAAISSRSFAPRRGTELRCRGWAQEAALRMLENNLDPDVAEKPDELIVYGGTGQGGAQLGVLRRDRRDARSALRSDETLLVQSGKPVGVFETHEDAPRVLIANAMLVPAWATADEFRRLERPGPDDVRADDGRLLDLHREPGHRAGDVRDLRGRRGEGLRRATSTGGSS